MHRTLSVLTTVALLLGPSAAHAGKGKKQEYTITVDGDEVIVMRDGKRVDTPKITNHDGVITIVDDDGETLAITVPSAFPRYAPDAFVSTAPALRIGVWLEPVSGALAAQLGIERGRGLVVERVDGDGPADKGGLKRYDVITTVMGKAVDDDDAVRDALGELEEGDHLELGVLRAGKTVEVDLVPEMREVRTKNLLGAYAPLAPNVRFFGQGDGDIAVIGEQARQRALEAIDLAREAESEALRETEQRLREMEERLRQMEEKLDP